MGFEHGKYCQGPVLSEGSKGRVQARSWGDSRLEVRFARQTFWEDYSGGKQRV